MNDYLEHYFLSYMSCFRGNVSLIISLQTWRLYIACFV